MTITTDFVSYLKYLADQYKPERIYQIEPGLAKSIWEEKYARKKEDDQFQNWQERATEVVIGNFSLLSVSPPDRGCKDNTKVFSEKDFLDSLELTLAGVMCYSGRHLQHGDENQAKKLMDLFSNCSTSPFCFLTLWKSLCGKGVTSDYSSAIRPVNWDNMPNYRLVLEGGSDDSGGVDKGAHPDFLRAVNEFQGFFESRRDAEHKYPSDSEWVRWFKVEDSREGWAQVLCALETAAYHEKHKEKLFIFDFSGIRAEGQPIMGHQGRPASGPIPLMRSLAKVATIKGACMPPWKQAMYVDDYMASCVSIGGVRRIARMAVMYWKDSAIFDFIEVKRGGYLRTANNTILVDKEFWDQCKDPRTKAYRVFQATCAAAYLDNTGEPGFANVHNMRQNRNGIDQIDARNLLNLQPSGLKLHHKTYDYLDKVLTAIKSRPYIMTPNPCGEANLSTYGDDCIVGDIGLQNARSLSEACRASELMAKALVRVSSLMPSMCQTERRRTNKIGVSAIGILEFFWNNYKLGFYDLISAYEYFIEGKKYASNDRVIDAWYDFQRISWAAQVGARSEAQKLGFVTPDIITLLKPGGTVAKVFGATESANLPNRRYDLRFIQAPKTSMIDGELVENPKVTYYRSHGYPVIDISHKYPGYVVIGFPRVMSYVRMLDEAGASDKIATSNNVSVEDHYKWLRLLECHWLGRGRSDNLNGQISYTLKYNPRKISYEQFMNVIAENQPYIRCCTFAVCSSDDEMAQETQELIDNYGWVPEKPISRQEYEDLVSKITQAEKEDFDDSILNCESGVCAIDESIHWEK